MRVEPVLIAAMIGGVLALSGIVVGQVFGLFSGHIERRHQRDVRQRERLERLADAVGETLPWFQALGRCRSLEEINANPPPPEARRAAMLAALYFPALLELAAAYTNSLVAYHHLAINSFDRGVPATVGAQIVVFLRSHPEAQRAHDDPLRLRLELDVAITREAGRYSHT